MKLLIRLLLFTILAKHIVGADTCTSATPDDVGKCETDFYPNQGNSLCLNKLNFNPSDMNPCVEVNCDKVTASDLANYGKTCDSFPDYEDFGCIINNEPNAEKACQLMILCNKKKGTSNEECNKYPVVKEKKILLLAFMIQKKKVAMRIIFSVKMLEDLQKIAKFSLFHRIK